MVYSLGFHGPRLGPLFGYLGNPMSSSVVRSSFRAPPSLGCEGVAISGQDGRCAGLLKDEILYVLC